MRLIKKYLLFSISNPFISRIFGIIARIKYPKIFVKKIILGYIQHFKIDTSEIEKSPLEYPSLSDFFTRNLKSGARTLDIGEKVIISPVDCHLISSGAITSFSKAMQIKGREYSVDSLTGSLFGEGYFKNGYYYQFYLSPKDYHHIHFPFDSKVEKAFYIKGRLLPVNIFSLENFSNVMSVNERIILQCKSNYGDYTAVLVGATNVGKISLTCSDFITNKGLKKDSGIIDITHSQFNKGDKMGCFHMGSTVILLFQSETINNYAESNSDLKMGQSIGSWR